MTRPAVSSNHKSETLKNGFVNSGAGGRPIATEARPNPMIPEDDNEGSISKYDQAWFITLQR